jgi:hypothetical protein
MPLENKPTQFSEPEFQTIAPVEHRLWLQVVYSKMSLRQKICLPFILVFLAIWLVGTSALGYYFSRHLEQKELQDTEALAKLILRDFEKVSVSLQVEARLLSENSAILEAVAEQDRIALFATGVTVKNCLVCGFD